MNSNPTLRYRISIVLLLPILLIHLCYRAAKDGGKRYFAERLGFLKPDTTPCLHVHAASVGEVLTALPLLHEIQQRRSDQLLLITTNTPTGADVLEKQMPQRASHAFLPLDFGGSTKRFYTRRNIIESWVIETEIWPWLFSRAKQMGKPVTVVNARLSDRSRGWISDCFKRTYSNALQSVRILARSERDATLYIERGAEPHHVRAVGNLKWAPPQQKKLKPTSPLQQPYVLAASTHENEEEQLAQAWLSATDSGLLVIAPRHPERGARIQSQLVKLLKQHKCGSSTAPRRSLDEPVTGAHRLYIADTLGELPDWYAGADATFVGGSLVKHGGHNVLEAARSSTPIIVGLHTFNFEQEVTLLNSANAITTVSSAAEAVGWMIRATKDKPWALSVTSNASKTLANVDDVIDAYCRELL